MRITVTTYGDMTAERALYLAALAADETRYRKVLLCGYLSADGATVTIKTTKTGGLSVKVQKFETEKAAETGGEA